MRVWDVLLVVSMSVSDLPPVSLAARDSFGATCGLFNRSSNRVGVISR